MRTKIIAMVLLAGGSMFAEGRATFPDPGHTGMARRMSRSDRPNSRGVALSRSYYVAPRSNYGFRDDDRRPDFTRNVERDRNDSFDQNQNFNGRTSKQNFESDREQTRDSGRHRQQQRGYGNQFSDR